MKFHNYKGTATLILISISITIISHGCSLKLRQYSNKIIYGEIPLDSTNISSKNKSIINIAQKYGPTIAPNYKQKVCTEYLIDVLSKIQPLSNDQKTKIRIITKEDLETLLKQNSEMTKGVVTAFNSFKLGTEIIDPNSVQAGDLVQFWNKYNGHLTGHCGIVRGIDPKKGLITIFSSSPQTNGHGIQTYVMPDYIYFVRLK